MVKLYTSVYRGAAGAFFRGALQKGRARKKDSDRAPSRRLIQQYSDRAPSHRLILTITYRIS